METAPSPHPLEPMNNFTPRAQQALALARREVDRMGQGRVGTEHLLLGMLREGKDVAARVLKSFGVGLETARVDILRELEALRPMREKPPGDFAAP